MRLAACFFSLLFIALPSRASARADFMGLVSGSGFDDQTAATPVGGNSGTTLGEQRRQALQHAFDLWGERLESKVPIQVAFEFEDLGCMEGTAILGGAAPTSAYGSLGVTGADPKLFYVSALANSLVGHDLDPDEPEIVARFNSSVDRECKAGTGGFYYGFDGKASGAVDFVQVVMHELAHGLGLTTTVNIDTGELLLDGPDSYSAHVRDLDLGKTWAELTAAERKASVGHVRRVVWDGENATKLVPQQFASGAPALMLEPSVADYSGSVADVAFAKNPALQPVHGRLVRTEGCKPGSVAAQTIILFPDTCEPKHAVQAALAAGAVAALVVSNWPFDAPAMPFDREPGENLDVALPALSIPPHDAAAVQRALEQGGLEATLGGDAKHLMGADDAQRAFLFASQPTASGSSISHLEELVRPNELMEPFASHEPVHTLGFTLALLRDIGWPLRCGDGHLDPGEACDDSNNNSDTKPDACRSDCTQPRCGDGVRDKGEECDAAEDNDDKLADACRTNCKRAACGDGVVDKAEQCDRGAQNSDSAPDACRKDCQLPRCGDGVHDALEQCDMGAANADDRADACRANCRMARCGDGVVDKGEECDDGKRNSATEPDACRADCKRARCGDGVVDESEECDSSDGCSDACKKPPAAVTPRAMPPKTDPLAGAATKESAVKTEDSHDAATPSASKPAADGGGCGCRIAGERPAPARGLGWLVAGAVCGGWWRRRRRRAL